MIDIPQDVRERVAARLFSLFPWALDLGNRVIIREAVDDIIPLAQLPIAPATPQEQSRFIEDYKTCPVDSRKASMLYAVNALFSRRNSPPKIDSLVEKIIAVQHRVRTEAVENCTIGRPDTVLREAEAIAAEVRKFAALDAMKEDGQ